MKKTIRDLLIEQINIANNLTLASVQDKDYQAAYEYFIRAESYQRLLQILQPTAEASDVLGTPVGYTNPYKSNSSFILTATFCYCCPHVQITNMGFDFVHAQTKDNHYVDPPPIRENSIMLYLSGNDIKSPRDEYAKRYGSPGDGELDMRSEFWEKE